MIPSRSRRKARKADVPAITVEGEMVCVASQEGGLVRMPLAEVFALAHRPRVSTRGLMLPPGVVCAIDRPGGVVLVHQTSPRVHNLRWICDDSPAKEGPGTTYRQVLLSLPWLVVLAAFQEDSEGKLHLSSANECFFRNQPLESLDDELFYPALLNCSRFHSEVGRPLSWICTQHLARAPLEREDDENLRVRLSVRALLSHLLDSGFNYSSDAHELMSWFTGTQKAGVDPRLSDVNEWQRATREDRNFALTVPWLTTDKSLVQVARRFHGQASARRLPPRSAADLARLVLNHTDPE